jgi:hypothetical protein
MEDIRPFRTEEADRRKEDNDIFVDWEITRIDRSEDDDVPFHVPRD